ncbi:MAG: HNH endonuclease [Chromatiales bacterium]|jgi:hypothetical protein|nr:HNH endonuclease [Chromatiales bacterium]
MATLLDRLLFAQGNKCFFCRRPLATGEASVEHLLGRSHGGTSADANVVACCRSVNALFGAMTVKEKLRVVLEQDGPFRCPVPAAQPAPVAASSLPGVAGRHPAVRPADQRAIVTAGADRARLDALIENLGRRGASRPRKLATLASTVNATFGKQLSEDEVQSLVGALRAEGLVHVNGEAVTYSLPATHG